jgi:hypothetical protein
MDDELLEKIRKSKVYQAATNQAVREGYNMETLQRFQKNWEVEILLLIKQDREATRTDEQYQTLRILKKLKVIDEKAMNRLALEGYWSHGEALGKAEEQVVREDGEP